jgi:hypothetical protein
MVRCMGDPDPGDAEKGTGESNDKRQQCVSPTSDTVRSAAMRFLHRWKGVVNPPRTARIPGVMISSGRDEGGVPLSSRPGHPREPPRGGRGSRPPYGRAGRPTAPRGGTPAARAGASRPSVRLRVGASRDDRLRGPGRGPGPVARRPDCPWAREGACGRAKRHRGAVAAPSPRVSRKAAQGGHRAVRERGATPLRAREPPAPRHTHREPPGILTPPAHPNPLRGAGNCATSPSEPALTNAPNPPSPPAPGPDDTRHPTPEGARGTARPPPRTPPPQRHRAPPRGQSRAARRAASSRPSVLSRSTTR